MRANANQNAKSITNTPTIYFIRHGETPWSLSGQHTSTTELELTTRGQQEAISLIRCIQQVEFSHVFSSPRLRTQHTCSLVGLQSNMQIEPDLAEWNYGDYEGIKTVEIRSTKPDWNIFQDGCPNGEMPHQICDRVDRVIEKLTQLKGNIALFSHGHLGCVLAARWIGLAVSQAQCFSISTGSLSVLGFDARDSNLRQIKTWNSSASLFQQKECCRHVGNDLASMNRAIGRWETDGGHGS